MRFTRKIWLRHVKCLWGEWIYFISLDVPASNFTMANWNLNIHVEGDCVEVIMVSSECCFRNTICCS